MSSRQPITPNSQSNRPGDLATYDLYARLLSYGISTLGQLESALKSDELPYFDRDSLQFCRNTLESYNDSHRLHRCVADKVHGSVCFSGDIWKAVIDTEPMQRLRHLKQMGGAPWVFPNAVHTRFEHSIGVGHLAGQWFEALKRAKALKGNVFELSVLKRGLQIAGLCHDLGHGPFSHAFETFAHHYDPTWRHEDMSLKLLDHMVDSSNHCDRISLGDVIDEFGGALGKNDIKGMMTGERPPTCALTFDDAHDSLRHAAFNIVANKVDGFDVDRFDYLLRDATVAHGLPRINPDRLMRNSSVNNLGQIVFDDKCQTDVYNFYRCRYDMFKNVYLHKNNQAVEFMLHDILMELNPIFRYSECLYDGESYLTLTDGVVLNWFSCARTLRKRGLCHIPTEFEANYERAKTLVNRLNSRDLYSYIGEITCDDPSVMKGITAERLFEMCSNTKNQLKASDIVVAHAKISHGAPLGCPWKSVLFFKGHEDENFKMDQSQWAHYPKEWISEKVMIYCRRQSPIVWDIIRSGIRVLTGECPQLQCSPHHETKSNKILHSRYTPTTSRRR